MVSMDREVAKRLFLEGAMVLIQNVPQGTEFGIDYNAWKVGSKFKGVKMIPPGLHFVVYSAISKDGQTAPRTGFFCFLKKRDIVVKKWDKAVEDIVQGDESSESVERIKIGMQELDKFLGPYPYESYKKWVSLSDKITEPLLYRLQPTCGKILSVTQVPSGKEFNSEVPKMEIDEENVNISFEQSPEHKIRFTPIPKKRYPEGSSPSEITQHSLDSTYVLEIMTQPMTDKMEILGELQFAFVCFLLGQVYDAFEHWKALLQVLCTSDDALRKYPKFFSAFIDTKNTGIPSFRTFRLQFPEKLCTVANTQVQRVDGITHYLIHVDDLCADEETSTGVLYFQLLEAPKDFFVDIVTKSNFLTVTLQVFFSNIETSADVDENLVKKAQRFRKHLTKRFHWDFESEPDEYEPVVVET